MWPVLLASAVWAQEVPNASPEMDVQNYRHSVDSTHTNWTDDAGTAPMGYFSGRVGVNYFTNPLVYYPLEGGEVGVLTDALALDVIAAINVSRLRLGVDLPFYVSTNSDVVGASNGLGDLSLDLKGTILDPKTSPFGLALAARTGLPTASVQAPLGSGFPTWEVSGIMDARFGTALLAGNLGYRSLPSETLEDLLWDDQLTWRLGAGYGFNDDLIAGVSLDIAGYATLPLPTQRELYAIEGLLGAWVKPTSELVIRGGLGTGATPAIGAPDLRAVFAVAYQPPHVRDEDADGILDKADDCPEDPEDKDGYRDSDGCPDPTTRVRVLFVDKNGNALDGVVSNATNEELDQDGGNQLDFEIHPDSVKISATLDGYAPIDETLSVPDRARFKTSYEMVPMKGKVVIRVEDQEGNPLDARVRVGDAPPFKTRDGKRAIAAKPGDYPVIVVADEYRPGEATVTVVHGKTADITITLQLAKAKVDETKQRIEILDKVYFDTGKATIKRESYKLLDDVGALIRAYPDIKLVRVEGHTDSRGSAEINRELSDARANSVRNYLMNQGIDGSRLIALGLGEDQPLDSRNNSRAWSKNRRVEFHIVERDGFDADGNPVEMEEVENTTGIEGAD